MPINRKDGDNGKFTLEFDNGDARAFDEIIKDWNFTDNAQAFIRFAMGVMKATKNKTIIVTKDDGTIEKILPGQGFVKENDKK